MYTFRDFLLEAPQNHDQVADSLLSQCMPYINAIGEVEFDTVLYRGTNAKIEDFAPRERKEAGGVTSKYSGERGDMLRNFFNKKCGMDLNNVIFATGDMGVAKTFGNPYVIFPIGTFKFVYSKAGSQIPFISTERELEAAQFVCGLADDNSEDGLPDPDLQNAVRSHNEILISASGYFPISMAYWKANAQAILENLSFR